MGMGQGCQSHTRPHIAILGPRLRGSQCVLDEVDSASNNCWCVLLLVHEHGLVGTNNWPSNACQQQHVPSNAGPGSSDTMHEAKVSMHAACRG